MSDNPDNKLNWEHDGNLLEVAKHLRDCASSWEPKVRLLGNCRAEGIAMIAQRYLELYDNVDKATNALTDSICCSGNDAATNLHFVRKLKNLL